MARWERYPPEIAEFLRHGAFAVVGASADRHKFGNKVLRCYLQNDQPAVAVNPRGEQVEGSACYASLRDVPDDVHAASIVAPPAAAAGIVADAQARGIRHLWFQPGAEDPAVVEAARQQGMHVIAGGPCLLVALGFNDA
jgi:predicted CoA-binding protein